MLDALQAYFAGEKAGAAVFVLCGGLALLAGVAFWFRGPFLKGVSVPLVAVALIHLGVGATVYLRTDRQQAERIEQLRKSPSDYRLQEGQRMANVQAGFERYRQIEIGLMVFGAGALGLGLARRRLLLAGLGAGLLWQAAFTLLLDGFAEARAETYVAAILAL